MIQVCNEALATEVVCVEADHAEKLATRIVHLGGEPDFNPEVLAGRSHTTYDGEELLADEEDHADDLRGLLERLPGDLAAHRG